MGSSPQVGDTLGHYRITERIGAGGMGVVYRAHDERLERDVALKVLPTGTLADEDARKRFRKEALALARLNHPNIAAVYDFDTQDGQDFLVMEYVPGGTLAGRLTNGALPEKEVVLLGAQIAAALEEAHEQGIVHRDLKPGNIAITLKGQAKVLDFGLAKLLQPASAGMPGDSLTASVAGAEVAGTLPYMAPEQVEGERVDARTDIYALGAVLYEMGAGRRPFQANSALRLSDAIRHEPPLSPRAVNAAMSPELDRIILKCLEKESENRYQSAKELAVDLRRLESSVSGPVVRPKERAGNWRRRVFLAMGITIALMLLAIGLNVGGWRERLRGKPVSPRIESLAVLPLENLSRDPDQEYFADGMTEALITELAQIESLKVISRTSVMRYKGSKEPLSQIAKELKVDAVVEGSVQRSGDKVGINVQLIHAPTDRHLWAKSYERDLRDVLTLQREVASAITREIRVKLTPQEQSNLARAHQVDRAAYEAYLKGLYYSDRRTREGLTKGNEYFQQAIALDPNYALAHAGLAKSYVDLGGWLGFFSPREFLPQAKAEAIKALGIDDTLAEAHFSLAETALEYDWDWSKAEREYRRAIELNPNYAPAHHGYGTYLEALARFDEAIAERKRAQELDPLSPLQTADVGYPFYWAGQYDQAIEHYRSGLELDPNFFWSHLWIGEAYVEKGMHEEAIAEIRKAVVLSASNTRVLATLGYAYGVSGRRSEALKVLNDLRARSKQSYVSPYFIALIYAGLGENNRTLEWLEKAYQERHPYLILLKVQPVFRKLHSDPRFQDLLRRIGFPP